MRNRGHLSAVTPSRREPRRAAPSGSSHPQTPGGPSRLDRFQMIFNALFLLYVALWALGAFFFIRWLYG